MVEENSTGVGIWFGEGRFLCQKKYAAGTIIPINRNFAGRFIKLN
jgi:hypothetical protein